MIGFVNYIRPISSWIALSHCLLS